jgi:non-ribosomal peptide synthetase component E (peptide arylation enzyme)
VAFVIIAGSEPPTLEELVEHFQEQGVAKQKTPERLEIVTEFPRTLAGKVQKHLLRKQLESA